MKYPAAESSTLEFKRELPSKQQIIKTIIGFCNMYGGTLIVGVDDFGEIIGINEESTPQIAEDLHRSIYASCTPPILPSLHTQRIDNKILLLIEVSEGMAKPYFHSSSGKQEGTFIRIGSETVKATPLMIQELEWHSMGKYLDQFPIYAATAEDIDLITFESFLKSRKTPFTESDVHKLLQPYGILTKEHNRIYPTLGGVLLFGKEPSKFLPESFIICTHFLGTSGREVVATRDCVGSLLEQYKECMSFILSRLNKKFTIKGAGARLETLEIPEEAIREIVINALIHRNYLIPGPTKIAIYDDRIEIFSPGNFPGPIHLDSLFMGMTYIRNTVIARIFREMGLVEKLGSGFLTVFRTYKERSLPTPVILEGTGFIKCILPRPVNISTSTEIEKSLLQLFYTKHEITSLDVMKSLSISRATANRQLKELSEEGLIKKIGKGPTSRYIKNS